MQNNSVIRPLPRAFCFSFSSFLWEQYTILIKFVQLVCFNKVSFYLRITHEEEHCSFERAQVLFKEKYLLDYFVNAIKSFFHKNSISLMSKVMTMFYTDRVWKNKIVKLVEWNSNKNPLSLAILITRYTFRLFKQFVNWLLNYNSAIFHNFIFAITSVTVAVTERFSIERVFR